jgi:formimidoylglutamate deiminase
MTHANVSEAGDVDDVVDARTLRLPGLVNAHSHAFQRALRGRVELRSAEHPDDDFWSWREAMYGIANAVTVDDVEALTAWAYLDMRRAGFSAVGEFHYLHHDENGRPHDDVLAMSRALVRAATSVGMRLVLLQTAYARGGFDRPLTSGQRRFGFPSVHEYLDFVAQARAQLTSSHTSVGYAVHSVRACSRDWIEAIAGAANDVEAVLHVHACEQTAEVDACLAATGMTPIGLLDACGALGPRTTIVHGTHLRDDDIATIAARNAIVCITPSTERNLGDGLCRIADLAAAGVRLCVGTDSHARIDAVDELRSLEDHERLRLRRRNVLTAPGGRLAQALLPAGTRNGRDSLGLADTLGHVDVRMPIEGRCGGAAIGLDALLVGGSSADVVDMSHAVDDDTAERIRERAAVVLKRLGSR